MELILPEPPRSLIHLQKRYRMVPFEKVVYRGLHYRQQGEFSRSLAWYNGDRLFDLLGVST